MSKKEEEVQGYTVDLSGYEGEVVKLDGIIDPKLLKAFQEEMDALEWCECEDSPGSYYVDDTPEMKHHWVCEKCGGITQIG